MDYTLTFQAIKQGQWHLLETSLTELIRRAPNDPGPLALAAHVSLCQGHSQRARVLAQKALGLAPEFTPAFIESALADLYQGDLERSYQALRSVSLSDLPNEHPAHLAFIMLCVIFDVNDQELVEKAKNLENHWSAMLGAPEMVDALMNLISGYETCKPTLPIQELPSQADKLLGKGNLLLANLFGKLCQIILPNSADSFLAVGIIDLHLGFIEGASRALYEAAHRQTSTTPSILWPTFKLFCRQQRYEEAIGIGNQLIAANAMTLDGMGYYIDLLVRCQSDAATIERYLEETLKFKGATQNPGICIASYRFALATKRQTPELIQDAINQSTNLVQSAPGLYLLAALIFDNNPAHAKLLAEKALALEPFHPDAARWINSDSNQTNVFEYMGLFLPTEHEGCAWPNTLQTELLQVIFAGTPDEIRIGWQAFLERHTLERLDAGCYRLLPLLHSRLTRECPNTDWPRREMLKGVWKKSFLENTTRLKTIMALTLTLESNGIKYVLLKGLANAIDLYGDLGARPMSDIDILISPDDLFACHQILTERGWQALTSPTKQRLRFQYASTYLHPDGGNLDLHWRPAEDFTMDKYKACDLGESITMCWMGQSIYMLNPTTNLACTILHGVAWNHLSPVRWVCDALLILEQQSDNIDWNQFKRLAERYHFKHIVYAGLRYLISNFSSYVKCVPTSLDTFEMSSLEDQLLNIRCRSRTESTNISELLALVEKVHQQFKLDSNDEVWVVANHLLEDQVQLLQERNIGHMRRFNPDEIHRHMNEKKLRNVLVLDGNLNGLLRTVSRNKY